MASGIQHSSSELNGWKLRSCTASLALVFVMCLAAANSAAQTTTQSNRLIVRDSLGVSGILNVCNLLGCSAITGLGDPQGQLFLIQTLAPVNSSTTQWLLSLNLGVVDVEDDQIVQTLGATAGPAPSYLNDRRPYTYYGTTVWHGYVYQPADELIRTHETHSMFHVAGSGVTVADIDTGVDPNNPVLASSLVDGYDFTRNQSGGSEMSDVNQSSVAVLDGEGADPAQVNQSSVAVLDQSSVAVLDNSQYAAFGHGTMTAGLIHLVAPQAGIMPLKAFQSDGTGYDSDILRAIYYAVGHGAKVINMSFSYTSYSQELANAVNYATDNGVTCVASAGNSGEQATVYPAALKNVIDVASTSNEDTPSVFSNYGAPPVWLAAPGEGVMTTYPFDTYAAGWGTSFSAPLVSGTTALLISMNMVQGNSQVALSIGPVSSALSLQVTTSAPSSEPQAANALSHADPINDPQMGYGRLDTYLAVQAWSTNLGLY